MGTRWREKSSKQTHKSSLFVAFHFLSKTPKFLAHVSQVCVKDFARVSRKSRKYMFLLLDFESSKFRHILTVRFLFFFKVADGWGGKLFWTLKSNKHFQMSVLDLLHLEPPTNHQIHVILAPNRGTEPSPFCPFQLGCVSTKLPSKLVC